MKDTRPPTFALADMQTIKFLAVFRDSTVVQVCMLGRAVSETSFLTSSKLSPISQIFSLAQQSFLAHLLLIDDHGLSEICART